MMIDKNKIEEAAEVYENNCFYDLGITEAFEAGAEYIESQLSNIAIEFGDHLAKNYIPVKTRDRLGFDEVSWIENIDVDAVTTYFKTTEDLFQEFLKECNYE